MTNFPFAHTDLRGADLSNADLSGADLRGAYLRGANLRGADLRSANLIGADLSAADLSGAYLMGANFSNADLRDANLSGVNLSGADFSGANLRDADLSGADLRDADLSGANLLGADFSDVDVPVIPDIDATILAAIEMPGAALEMARWHTCETTHCRAGWAIHLAGDAGYALEERLGSSAAGALIYAASGSHPVPEWGATDEDALEDLRLRAQKK